LILGWLLSFSGSESFFEGGSTNNISELSFNFETAYSENMTTIALSAMNSIELLR